MKRPFLFMILLIAILSLFACSPSQEKIAKAWEMTEKMFGEASTPGEKVDILKGFLQRYPESDQTGDVIEELAYLMIYEVNDAEGVAHYLEDLLDRVRETEIKKSVRVTLAGVLGKLGNGEKLRSVVAGIPSGSSFSYSDHSNISYSALDCKIWDLGLEHADAALELATPEVFKSDYPDYDFTPERLERYADRRKAESLVNRGWALSNLEQYDEALAAFSEGASADTFSMVGIPETRLNYYRGVTLFRMNRMEEAKEALIPDAIFANDSEALAVLQDIYTAGGDSEEPFSSYTWKLRVERAAAGPDFSLPDYEDAEIEFAEIKGEKVTLLTFWFPT